MYYTSNNEKYKFIEQGNNNIKLYHRANNKYCSGWTYIGTYKNKKEAQVAANKYSS